MKLENLERANEINKNLANISQVIMHCERVKQVLYTFYSP